MSSSPSYPERRARLYPLVCTFSLVGMGLWLSAPIEAKADAVDVGAEGWTHRTEGLDARALSRREVGTGGRRFTRVDGVSIGVDFRNLLKRENIKNYLLSGAGLSIGDFDGNGLPDLFLVSQDGANKLFRQVTPWHFEDVTEAAGLNEVGAWGSGAAFADMDNDGDLDLYLCNKGAHDIIYLNEGDGTFEKNEFGAGDASLRAPTMVAFSDYDMDGDLDLYRTETRLLSVKEMFNFSAELVRDENGKVVPADRFRRDLEMVGGGLVELGTYDHLIRNEGLDDSGELVFRDVTRASGISIAREHGLAAVWWDYDNDNAPDLYVANDFQTPDHLYRNQGDGTFVDEVGGALCSTSWNSMGSDFADVNNDGWFDYLSTDMSATTHFKQKAMMGAMSATAWFLDNLEPRQYMRNALHVNTGTGKFVDVAFFAGLDSTDWTWEGIFGDLDNDGFEDAFFTNGIERNVQDSDLSKRMDDVKKAGGTWNEIQEVLLSSPRFKEANMAFRNRGEFKFENVSEAWGLGDLTVSHGAVMADLDRDGDLDLVVNNMNDPVGIYRNDGSSGHAILVSLRGTDSNRFGLGARIEVRLADGGRLTRIMTSSRGYMSGVEPVIHFGLGQHQRLESLRVVWPSGKVQSFQGLESGHHYRATEAGQKGPVVLLEKPDQLFAAAEDGLGIVFNHQENDYNDFEDQPLLPNRLSREGPAMAVGDATGDENPDLFFGAAGGYAAALFVAGEGGRYEESELSFAEDDKGHEDVAALWFDADGDDDLDLYVVSGGGAEEAGSEIYRDRLYLNDGSGKLERASREALPDLRNSGSCVAAGDLDGDGDLDLFVGSRHVPKRYPTVPESSVLLNEGGIFKRMESAVDRVGLVTDAVWADVDGDERKDLIVATEWGPLKVFRNESGVLVERTAQAGLSEYSGWWTCIEVGDLDHDGDLDLVAGNFGTNTKYHVDEEHPAVLFASDFGNQGMLQLVEAKQKEGKLLPVRGRSCSTTAMPHLKKLAPTYKEFASMTLPELYSEDALEEAIRLEANTLESMVFRNDGTGSFTPESLPALAQMSPVMDIAMGDFDNDQITDLALGQGFNDAQRETGRMNAGLGVVLKGSAEGKFAQLWPIESGYYERSNLRQLRAVDLNRDGALDLISSSNGDEAVIHLGDEPRDRKAKEDATEE